MLHPTDRFAAAVAHCLKFDGDEPFGHLNPDALRDKVMELLTRKHNVQRLLYHETYASEMSAEEAATRYYDEVLLRPIMLTGAVQISVGHRVLAMMSRRGPGPEWRHAEIQRRTEVCHDTAASSSASFEEVRGRLARLRQSISKGSASPTLRERHGPIVLLVEADEAPVPEEITAWDSLVAGPRELLPLADGTPEFRELVGALIDCFRTCNRWMAELLALNRNLCPFDWVGSVSIHQLRSWKRFLTKVAAMHRGDTNETWRLAFDAAPVAGFDSVEALRDSPFGNAVWKSHMLAMDSEIIIKLPGPIDVPDEVLRPQEFSDQLALLLGEGVIRPFEVDLVQEIYGGADLDDLQAREGVRFFLRGLGLSIEEWVADIQTRIAGWQDSEEPS